MVSASYVNGKVQVILKNSLMNGYSNTVNLYQTPNTISVPLARNLINIDSQGPSQVQMTGYNSVINDENYTIAPGEFTGYSQNWYVSARNGGVEVQQVNTTNKENLPAGQSTNSVLSDMLGIIIEIITYLGTHTHSGVTTGGGNSGPVVTPPPSDTDIVDDKTYIDANKNLFITGTYEPR